MDPLFWFCVLPYLLLTYLYGFFAVRECNSKVKIEPERVQGRVVYSLGVWLCSPLLCFWFSVLFFYEPVLSFLGRVFKVEEAK